MKNQGLIGENALVRFLLDDNEARRFTFILFKAALLTWTIVDSWSLIKFPQKRITIPLIFFSVVPAGLRKYVME